MYNPPGTSPNVENFKFILNKYPDSIFMGDYNSKHEFFGCKKYNKDGDILFNILEELNLIVSNDGTPTHYTNTSSDMYCQSQYRDQGRYMYSRPRCRQRPHACSLGNKFGKNCEKINEKLYSTKKQTG